MPVAHVHAHGGQRIDEQRLQVVLGEVAQRRGRHGENLVPLAFVGQASDDVAAEFCDPVDGTGVGWILRVGADEVDVEADLTPNLECACVDGVSRRSSLGAVADLHDEYGATEAFEQQPGREPNGPCTYDQDVDVDIVHLEQPW